MTQISFVMDFPLTIFTVVSYETSYASTLVEQIAYSAREISESIVGFIGS